MYIGEKCCILLANMVPDLPFGAAMECSEHFIARVTFGKHIIALMLFGGNPSGEGEIEKMSKSVPCETIASNDKEVYEKCYQ